MKLYPIAHYSTKIQFYKIGRVVSVGDGIARVYGLNEIQVGEMVEFASGVKGIALNLENENVVIVIIGSNTAIKEGSLVKRTGSRGIPIYGGFGAAGNEKDKYIHLFGEGKG
jgi:F-type H+-transporting ATPase subunit alpha